VAKAELETPGKRLRRVRALAACAAGLLCGLAVFNYILMPLYVGKGNQTRVPPVIGEKVTAAQAELSRAGLKIRKEIGQPRSDYPAGVVVDQKPGPGMLVKEGRGVTVVISTGPVKVMVPVLRGEEVRRAEIALNQMGLKRGRVAYAYSSFFPRGTVVATSPPAGKKIRKSSLVDLLVSLGKMPEKYVMPDITGMDREEAERILEGAGFHVLERRVGDEGQGRRVLDQSPFAGSCIAEGDTVEVVIGESYD